MTNSKVSALEIIWNMIRSQGGRLQSILNQNGCVSASYTISGAGYELAEVDSRIVLTCVSGPDAGKSEEVWTMSEDAYPSSPHPVALEDCAYCFQPVDVNAAIPALHDEEGWFYAAIKHDASCEWVRTRAHRLFADDQSARDSDNFMLPMWSELDQ